MDDEDAIAKVQAIRTPTKPDELPEWRACKELGWNYIAYKVGGFSPSERHAVHTVARLLVERGEHSNAADWRNRAERAEEQSIGSAPSSVAKGE